jgi:hypothetical protein
MLGLDLLGVADIRIVRLIVNNYPFISLISSLRSR